MRGKDGQQGEEEEKQPVDQEEWVLWCSLARDAGASQSAVQELVGAAQLAAALKPHCRGYGRHHKLGPL